MNSQAEHRGLAYRPDIDGLRALAIVPVVLYHANLGVPGGFVGVDAFFVISGFLITRIIYSEMVAGTFSYANFYERRIRRLLPAAFAVFAVTTAYVLIAMTWFDAASYGRSLAAATAYVANFNFYWDTGYFSDDATTMPLLHTWSLAVEEQFYIVVPIALAIMLRCLPRKLILPLLAAVTVLGFILCVWLTSSSQMFAYFLLPARAWELGTGGVLALAGTDWVKTRLQAELLTGLGIALIIIACFTINDATAFPGWHAAIPVLGSVALLAAGHFPGTLANRLLRLGPMVWIGQLSYSLYLWHWPVIVAAGYGTSKVSGIRGLVAVGISLALAWLSLRFIETPVRRRQVLADRRKLFMAAAAGTALFVAMGLVLYFGNGLPDRFQGRAQLEVLLDEHRWNDPREECYNLAKGNIAGGAFCVRGRTGVSPSFALIGDSHAQAIAPGVFEAANRLGAAGVQFTAAGYFPMPGRKNLGVNYAPDLDSEVFAWLDANPQVRTLVLAGYWRYEATSITYRHNGTIFADEGYDGSGLAYNPVAFHNALERLVARFPDRQFVFLDDAPTGRELYVRHYLRGVVARGSGLGTISRDEAEQDRAAYAAILERLDSEHGNVVYLPILFDQICSARECPMFETDGMLRYIDGDHLSAPYALRLTPVFETALAPHLAAQSAARH